MTDNVNVLDVLDDIWKRGFCVNNVTAFDGARSRIADLIAADLEYDEAMENIHEIGFSNHERLVRAEERRAAALSACTGGSDE